MTNSTKLAAKQEVVPRQFILGRKDVLSLRPDLNPRQAEQVLEASFARVNRNSNLLSASLLDMMAGELFPPSHPDPD